jgi:hypothetical protein
MKVKFVISFYEPNHIKINPIGSYVDGTYIAFNFFLLPYKKSKSCSVYTPAEPNPLKTNNRQFVVEWSDS